MKGRIKFFLKEKKYGFIKTLKGDDYFFHESEVSGPRELLRKGRFVEFTPESAPKGNLAVAIILL